ncbi:succinate-semialdehyde dehydrogenase [Flavobacterium cyanobacteriorum]|uniref:Succinate-semialdehyde dehydrogenase n=1 Tax=Flavobacterium cyanobacteriorum TaxID=2022802 RepID=A0A255Z739_9FLAO|nr:NAD-dependent succinate-semialdehyde dehydrogenase [Flavobacterium cyanobacteriorum]OYQ37231.1 succinate-semialdehyde dehydrogenase [Flavobacterium cyanobacteriorum]
MFSIINPFDLTFLAEYEYITDNQAVQRIDTAHNSYNKWRCKSLNTRLELVKNLLNTLTNQQKSLSEKCSLEMGKPIAQAVAEVKKCGLLCEYYIKHAPGFLAEKPVNTDAAESFVVYEPLGVILGIMPWNFPYWQVFRFAIPAIIVGNTVVVKHASNVAGCAQLLESLFTDAGFPEGIYQNLLISGEQVKKVIENPIVKAVSLTGSEKAGISVATVAASQIKKSVLELGGSNAFIVLGDADLDKAASVAVSARMQNTGQSCIAAKRFLVHSSVYEDFLNRFRAGVEKLKPGNPLDTATDIGPLARLDLAKDVEKQVDRSVAMGAKVLTGGKRDKAFYAPTIVTDVTTDMPVFKEEVFGPVAAVIKFETFEEAVTLSNSTDFGLGVTLFTRNIDDIKDKLHLFEEGAVFINAMVKSDPALPFGGVKRSGYGRELAENGLKEFVNVKTVYINK